MKTLYLCGDCLKAFQEGGLELTYKPKKPLSILLANNKHSCYITEQDNNKRPIRLSQSGASSWNNSWGNDKNDHNTDDNGWDNDYLNHDSCYNNIN